MLSRMMILAAMMIGFVGTASGQCANGRCPAPVRYAQPAYRVQAPATYARPAYQAVTTRPTHQAPTATYGDPLAAVNAARSRRGLHALIPDPSLAAWAQRNNAEQARRGALGHFVNCGAAQCAAVGTPSPQSAVNAWANSPAHAALMFSPSYRFAGLSVDGSSATLNLK